MLYHHELLEGGSAMDSDDKIQKAYESILNHDFEQAIEWFEQAVKEEPNNPDHHYKLSITFARSNKLDKALLHARKAYGLDQNNEKFRFHLRHLLGRWHVVEAEKCFEADGKLSKAVSLLKEAIRLDPLNFEAYLLLGIAYAEMGEYKRAVKALDEALELDPHNEMAKKLIMAYNRKLH
jgi:Flp pilus assembly protein TadD